MFSYRRILFPDGQNHHRNVVKLQLTRRKPVHVAQDLGQHHFLNSTVTINPEQKSRPWRRDAKHDESENGDFIEQRAQPFLPGSQVELL